PGVEKISKELFGDREGSHATPSEVSVTQFAYPEAIKQARMEPVGKPPRAFADAEDYRRLFPDGRIGSDPSLSSPEHGKRLVEAAVADIIQDYRTFLTQA
ncbi:MAG: creatininase family protein, partial [Alphaproteobacteria bacterium]|nr:creatininase family protein [Alphaproteobacteria bacterium]